MKRFPMWLWAVPVWWAVYALVFASQVVQMNRSSGNNVTWDEAFAYSFGGWMTWVPLTLGLYWVVQRFPITRGRVAVALALQSLAVAGAVVLKAAYIYETNPIFDWYEELPSFGTVVVASLHNNFMLAWTVVGVAHAFVYSEQARLREKKMAEMEKGLVAAKLDALKAQMNPHFLFNALSSVAEMVHKDQNIADEMLVSLSELLRDAMRINDSQQRPLRDEVELAHHYLMIEKIRLGDRLETVWDIDENCESEMVPVLILQPLVENAIVHGIARRKAAGRLIVRAHRLGSSIIIGIENSPGPGQGQIRGNGIALRSTGDRLSMLYGAKASLTRKEGNDGRYLVELVIPVDRRAGLHGIAL